MIITSNSSDRLNAFRSICISPSLMSQSLVSNGDLTLCLSNKALPIMCAHNCLSLGERFFALILCGVSNMGMHTRTHTQCVQKEILPMGSSVIKVQTRWSREKMSSRNQLTACYVSVNISPGTGYGCWLCMSSCMNSTVCDFFVLMSVEAEQSCQKSPGNCA